MIANKIVLYENDQTSYTYLEVSQLYVIGNFIVITGRLIGASKGTTYKHSIYNLNSMTVDFQGPIS